MEAAISCPVSFSLLLGFGILGACAAAYLAFFLASLSKLICTGLTLGCPTGLLVMRVSLLIVVNLLGI